MISYTDDDRRNIQRSWRTCTPAELDKLALTVERCADAGAFSPSALVFLRRTIRDMRERLQGAPVTPDELREHTARVAAELRARAAEYSFRSI